MSFAPPQVPPCMLNEQIFDHIAHLVMSAIFIFINLSLFSYEISNKNNQLRAPAWEHCVVLVFLLSSLLQLVLVSHELVEQVVDNVGREYPHLPHSNVIQQHVLSFKTLDFKHYGLAEV